MATLRKLAVVASAAGALAIAPGALALERCCEAMLVRHHAYIREHFEDMPEVRDWTWPERA